MAGTEKLEGKDILIVDDEPDVLDSLEQLLSMCHVVKASTFEEAKKALDIQHFDFAILDIMGVDGYALLDLANQKKVIAVMLTAHALNPENIIRSYKEGAASYIPKEKMGEIAVFLSDILEAKEEGKHPWWRWLDRLTESYFEKKFGPDWRNRDEKFWEKFKYDLGH
jgi:DNA-binding NtrC family response regulator